MAFSSDRLFRMFSFLPLTFAPELVYNDKLKYYLL